MIVEGLVFRVVTASHPGDPSLEEFGCVRTEFLGWNFGWTCDRDRALRFPTHLSANVFAHERGWHAMVVAAPAQSVPEQLATVALLEVLPPATLLPAPPVRKSKQKSRVVLPLVNPPRPQSWVNEVYG